VVTAPLPDSRSPTVHLYLLDADCALSRALAAALGVTPAPVEIREYEDGEEKVRPLADPRDADVCVVHGLHGGPGGSPHDRLVRLLMFVATLRDHGAARVTVVLPYMAYARKDRTTKPFDPIASRYVAQLLEASGASRVVVLEAHDLGAMQNAFRIPTIHVSAHEAFDELAAEWIGDGPAVVVSPDPGGVKRAQLWREHLEARLARPVGFAMIDKRRRDGQVGGFDLVAGEVRDATALLLDDMIVSGGTLAKAARALRTAGAKRVVACAAHGLLVPPADTLLADAAIDAVAVTDSVPPSRVPPDGPLAAKLRIVSAAPLLARALRPGSPGG
jgi:ribose-phosphate pyrophosphokinase